MNSAFCKTKAAGRGLSLWIVVLLGAAIAGAACGDSGKAETAARSGDTTSTGLAFSPAQVQHGNVRWAPAEVREMAATLELPGQLIPDEDRTERLGAPASGRVIEVHVRLGDRVTRGQPLVTLQSQEASAARADHAKALAELNSRRVAATYSRTAKERAQRLLTIKAIARQEVERADADDQLAQAGLAQAEAELARAQAALRHLGVSSTSGAMVLRSPLAGVVLSRDAVPGAVVDVGAPLAAVSDPASLWLEVAAPDRAAAVMRPGSRVHFTVPAFPEDTFEAVTQSVAAALDPETRTLTVRASVKNPSGKLRSATFATVWLESARRQEVVVVPENAVQLLNGKQVVFVAIPDRNGGARFERREVEVGAMGRGQTQILRGLSRRDTVVVEGAFAVKSEFVRSKTVEG